VWDRVLATGPTVLNGRNMIPVRPLMAMGYKLVKSYRRRERKFDPFGFGPLYIPLKDSAKHDGMPQSSKNESVDDGGLWAVEFACSILHKTRTIESTCLA
jgi:hypothetical protein